MTQEVSGLEPRPLAYAFSAFDARDESSDTELSPRLRAELLDFEAWAEILDTYGRTMKVAVALTDPQGRILGECHNAQPVWTMIRDAVPASTTACEFCLSTLPLCTAVVDALRSGDVEIVRDQAGLTHVAVPLLLGRHLLGAIVAGQVSDQYTDSLSLRRVAKEFNIPAQDLWEVARVQRPVGRTALRASGDLLRVLGRAFLRERYGSILEARLARSNGRFRLLVEGVKDYALFTMDGAGFLTSWNAGAEKMLGYEESHIIGQNFSRFFSDEDIQNGVPQDQLNRALVVGRTEDDGWRVGEGGAKFWATVNITAIPEDAGPVRSLTIIVHNATERREIANLLEESRQERVRIQSKLLSHVSHELRTPLTAIYFFTSNVLDGLLGELTPEQREHLTFVLDNVNQLKSMVSDLLEVTRVESYKLSLEPQCISPVKLIAEVLGACITGATAKSIKLCSEVAPDVHFIWADPARVRQILTNLIDNGIKFTPRNGTVTVKSQLYAEDEGFLCLSISDTGYGISPENCKVVFDRLTQVNNGTEASRSGLGLGLFIANELVRLHGGRMWVESQLGEGSTFYFTIPLLSLPKLCARAFTAPNLAGGFVTLIAVDVSAVDGPVQPNLMGEIREILKSCIYPQDVILPSMNGTQGLQTVFVVAWVDAIGSAVIASRVERELQKFDNASQLKSAISSTTLLVASGESREEQISEVTKRTERLIRAHTVSREKRQ